MQRSKHENGMTPSDAQQAAHPYRTPTLSLSFTLTFTDIPQPHLLSLCFLKLLRPDPTPFHDAFQCPDGDRFRSVKGHDHLPSVRISPLLVAACLVDFLEPMLAQHPRHFLGVADRKAAAHAAETATTLARPGNLILEGLNQRDKACRAFRTASLSLSPAEAHPGISGNTADHRPVS